MVANGKELNGLNLFSRVKGIVDQNLGHLFIASSCSHFLNKTDLEQYLFKYQETANAFFHTIQIFFCGFDFRDINSRLRLTSV